MVKKFREGIEIEIAPGIVGSLRNGVPSARDPIIGETYDPRDIDDKIKIFERMTTGWFLDVAEELQRSCRQKHIWNFAGLMIAVSYVEATQRYIEGKECKKLKSGLLFSKGISRISGQRLSEDQLTLIYKHLRCGLFHEGMTKQGILLSNQYPEIFDFSDPDILRVNVDSFITKVKEDFSNYLTLLKNGENEEARKRFDEVFDIMPRP